jgi:UPF0176 protein
MTTGDYTIIALYRFTALPQYTELRQPLLEVCTANNVFGTILLASEGINGTIAGPAAGIDAVLDHIRGLPGCAGVDVKWSSADDNPFYRMKVRLKREIVTMGVPDIDPAQHAGDYVEPEDWNDLISDPDVVVIDTRNDYEVGIGTFERAINPNTTSFRDFPAWLDAQPESLKDRKVAMFCTGGIRCEKSTALARKLGFRHVFHLRGGILNYFEKVPAEQTRWLGECFVFDQRVSVNHRLEPGQYDMCHACRMPLNAQERAAPEYVEGVSCPHCFDARSDEQRQRYAERQRQVERAETRGAQHLGTAAQPSLARKRT